MDIIRRTLEDNESITFPASIFGTHFPFKVEPFVFDLARSLSSDYTGGCWNMYELSNGGFYMTPESDTAYHTVCMNGYEGTLSADTFGITVCFYAYSNLSFSGNPEFAETCAKQYHLLREYMFEHPEVREILEAID